MTHLNDSPLPDSLALQFIATGNAGIVTSQSEEVPVALHQVSIETEEQPVDIINVSVNSTECDVRKGRHELMGNSSSDQSPSETQSAAESFSCLIRQQLTCCTQALEHYSDSLPYKVLSTCLRSLQYKYCSCESLDPSHGLGLANILENYTKSLGDMHPTHPEESGDFDMTSQDNKLLCCVAGWLGDSFGKMSHQIASNVEHFKMRHIKCIDNLPPAKDILDGVFPKCMVMLFNCWLNAANSLCPADHSYSVAKKLRLSSSHNLSKDSTGSVNYPLIQLLLEFANNTLISGVAHVVYSRVMQSV